MKTHHKIPLLISLLLPLGANAETDFYVESDPIAFALDGHSIHVGIEADHIRFQAGLFGATLPESFKDNDKFDVKLSGYGLKLDYFMDKVGGGFIGMTYSRSEKDFTHATTNLSASRDSNLLGVRVGYKYRINEVFYVMPWLGVSKNLSDTSALQLSGDRYKVDEWTVFPTVHLGMQF